ncbi:hypothetical protein D2E64_18505 [Mycobacteroides abscessus]|uniref:hypothetical protein n=1 Tax=Mycobacteroides abscessus TaxID=36809 RepID=UPI000D3E5440|nr:hypothetical protein [Mycobacteroides abscessus]MBN7567149.1 hypothetical protein [Mycobacteroides abscessus subsp. massiliense]PVA72254.1 hypothetical protein DDJ76_22905 [Mycobacteroides abscessus]RIS03926.1 hypothetical protein D2E63_22525 [Mycobacteroides abscessus]RIS11317.1 hypothetical protein D2E69_22285 [Mycobacteroides abscessus]RIS23578.1 hypothetical protein D2E67_22170 [Mycobacteroides abscessus]
MITKFTRTAIGALTAFTAAALSAAPTAAADLGRGTVGAGHTIRYISAQGASTCTLAFSFLANGHTYGVTAGHCVAAGRGYIQDANTGTRGGIVTYDYDDSRAGNDFALIDFGNAPSAATLGGERIAETATPAAHKTLCHTGAASGTSCGQLATRYGTQYLTEGMDDIPGDSGGPVWSRTALGNISIVGIWLGSHVDFHGNRYGRFYPINEALTGLGLKTAAERM